MSMMDSMGRDYGTLLLMRMLAETLVEKKVITKEELLENVQRLTDRLVTAEVEATFRNYPPEAIQVLLDAAEKEFVFFKAPFLKE